ncbi:8-amino-7-oxononanoate synthase [Maribrevibacterium harenarium]|uniref:8-amino-7-oxononanoate synthase n=1 Tax=Maribrevibacterium harenarium TaxID=2589817 RepID=A0A501X2K5_9GAMM|nr:8-amino-7-oxononanoate synthase [Maribrevibacterium harenarium]TPE54683.1 8-amino-7-oxononanoate synthase [Maribrevibacterium harenarium]
MPKLPNWLTDSLVLQRERQLWRQTKVLAAPQNTQMSLAGETYLSFCSNDYLGLADHPALKQALAEGALRYGAGSGSSHLVSGHLDIHDQLEQALAQWLGVERVLLFSTGYMANLAVISALGGKDCPILQDKLNHASLIDGAQLSQAPWRRYLHGNVDSAAKMMARMEQLGLLVTDGVFSMDGDIAPLSELVVLADQEHWMTMVDDAHGLGCLGDQGQGSLSLAGLKADAVTLLVGTFGKAFGTAGAFVACSQEMAEYLTQFARPYIYTTAMAPAMAAATLASLELICSAEGDQRRQRLSNNIALFKQSLPTQGVTLMASDTAIQPIVIGDSGRAMAVSAFLQQQGILCTAIRPPTVPAGSARLRITLSADHTQEDIVLLCRKLADAIDYTSGGE